MKQMRFVVCVALVASACSIAVAQSPQSIVDRFYPRQLLDSAYPDDRGSCFAVMQLGADGQPSVIVADYLAARGQMRVLLRGADGAFTAKDSPAGIDLGGASCSIELVHVTGHEANEIHLSTWGATVNHADWLFSWNGSTLITLNPVTKERFTAYTDWGNVTFVDLYHDAALAAYCDHTNPTADDGPADAPDKVWRWRGGSFQLSTNALFLAMPVGAPDSPFIAYFALAKGSVGPYTLRVVNGDNQGDHRASGRVLLNGRTVATFKVLGDSITSSPITVKADAPNNVTVTLDSLYTDGDLTVVVEDATPPPAPPTSLAVSGSSFNSVDLSFVPSATGGVYAYRFYRDTKRGVVPSPATSVELDQNLDTYSDLGLSPSTSYFYVVEAENGYGISATSNEATATTAIK